MKFLIHHFNLLQNYYTHFLSQLHTHFLLDFQKILAFSMHFIKKLLGPKTIFPFKSLLSMKNLEHFLNLHPQNK